MATDNCPECRMAAQYMRSVADVLARGAGAEIGGAIAGPRGAAIGAQYGPQLIERGALAVARKVKRSSKQRKRASIQKRAMKKVQARARKANGSLKKGWDQSRIMTEMHKECRRLLK